MDEFCQAESFLASNRGHTEHNLHDELQKTKESSIREHIDAITNQKFS